MNKVLIVTYVFPPAAWVGAHRTLKYCKYLGRHGWVPIVLTAKPIGVTFQDENLARQIPPEVVVYRTLDLDPAKLEDKLDARRLRRSKPATKTSATQYAPSGARPMNTSSGLIHRLKQLVKSILTDCPDSHMFWVPFAFFKGAAILLRKKVNIIYCTTPPHSSHLAAYLLAKCFRKPYILDFRDPWYVNGSAKRPVNKASALLQVETRMKRRIIEGAARVICVSEGERDELRAEFPEIHEEHFTYITNGYDPEDLPNSGIYANRSPRLSLIHTGTIYSGIAGEFFEALRLLVEKYPLIARSIEVQLLGEIAGEYSGVVRFLEESGVVKVHGLQPHAKALQMVRASHVPIILMGGTKYLPSHLPSKLFEYLNAGKPIFAIAAEGEVTQILRRSGLGIIVPPNAIDSVVDCLRDLIADHHASRLTRVPEQSYIRSFERAALTEKLVHVLDEVKEGGLVHQHCRSR